MKNRAIILNIASSLVGGYFIVSGIGKLLDMEQLIETVQIYGVPSPLSYVAILLPPMEIIIGLLVLLSATRKPSSSIMCLLLLIFTGAYLYAHLFKGVQKCGCSGRFSFLDKNFPQLLAVNAVLFLLSSGIFVMTEKHSGTLGHLQKLSIIMVVVLALTTGGVFAVKFFEHNNGKLIDDNARSTPFSQTLSVNRDSTYALFFYDTSCPHCWDAVGTVESLQSQKVVDEVIGFTFGDDSSVARFERLFHPKFATELLPVERFYTLIDSVPAIIFISDDSVIYRDQGQVKSTSWYAQHVFKKM